MSALSVPAVNAWPTNGDLIANIVQLGYITDSDRVLDPTYGLGRWWTRYTPPNLTASDLDPDKSPLGESIDFTDLPWEAESFDVIAFDPPYKLNGTPSPVVDGRYGVDAPATWQQRHELIRSGITELTRVLAPRGHLLLKCMDQVSSGAVRWQTFEFTNHATSLDLRLVDRFDMTGQVRAQPQGRIQRHAHGRPSTLLVFLKP